MRITNGHLAVAAVGDWCRRNGVVYPLTEHYFARSVGREYRFDMAWPALMVALEVNGGAFVAGGGGHNRGKAYEDDCERSAVAAALGWRVVPCTYRHLNDGRLLTWLAAALGVAPLPPAPKPVRNPKPQRLFAARKVRAE